MSSEDFHDENDICCHVLYTFCFTICLAALCVQGDMDVLGQPRVKQPR